jgi:predicted membrane chloride channel (bestrophin family)
MLEVTKTIIGLGLLSIIAMYGQFISNTPEYQRLSRGTAKMWGNIRYSLDRTLRSIWADINEIEDKLRGEEIKAVRYF